MSLAFQRALDRALDRATGVALDGDGAGSILFFDNFLTEEAAPLASPRTAEPGPGSSTLVDTFNENSINSSGEMVWPNTLVASDTDPILTVDSTFQVVPGLAIGLLWERTTLDRSFVLRIMDQDKSTTRFSFKPNDVDTNAMRFSAPYHGSGEETFLNGTGDAIEASTPYDFVYINTGCGHLAFIRGGTNFPNWTLALACTGRGDTIHEEITPRISNFNSELTVDGLKVIQNDNFNNCWAAAEAVDFIPSAGAFTHDADAFICFDWSADTAETLTIRFRRTDDDNCWLLECDVAASECRLSTVLGGTVTPVAGSPVSKTWTTTFEWRIMIGLRGQNVMVWATENNSMGGNDSNLYSLSGQTHEETTDNGTWTCTTPDNVGTIASFKTFGVTGASFDDMAPSSKFVASNPDLFLAVTDVHYDSGGAAAMTTKSEALALAHLLNGYGAAGLVNMGDNKDPWGATSVASAQGYKDYFWDLLNMPKAQLRGNHDEDDDVAVDGPSAFTEYDSVFSDAYNQTVDWTNPQLRFICFHIEIRHNNESNPGSFGVTLATRNWVQTQLDDLPVGWKAVLCSHAPQTVTGFTNNIHADEGGSELNTIVSTESSKIAACLSGHRHQSCHEETDGNGIKHFSLPNTAAPAKYMFALLDFDGASTVTIRLRHSTLIPAPVHLAEYDGSPVSLPSFNI